MIIGGSQLDNKIKELKKQYKNTPIPKELDSTVHKALHTRKKRSTFRAKWFIGVAAALCLFVISVNTSPALAQSLTKIPVLGSVIQVVTFQDIQVENGNYHAHLKTPQVNNLDNKDLENSLNQKYVNENQKLYDEFTQKIEQDEDGHFLIESGYEVKTNNDLLLSIGRYTEEIQASSATTLKYDTIDKQRQIMLTLPILFKNNDYINTISEEIKEQMRQQIKEDPDKIYWVDNAGIEDLDVVDKFEKIDPNQNFYINEDHKLVISFNDYTVAPGYMGVVEFVIPTEVIADDLVGNQYIK